MPPKKRKRVNSKLKNSNKKQVQTEEETETSSSVNTTNHEDIAGTSLSTNSINSTDMLSPLTVPISVVQPNVLNDEVSLTMPSLFSDNEFIFDSLQNSNEPLYNDTTNDMLLNSNELPVNLVSPALTERRNLTDTFTEKASSTPLLQCMVSIQPMQSPETRIRHTSIEIIDVDKLPDLPDSPIGDDVIEIIPGSSSSRSRTFVDLTDEMAEGTTAITPPIDSNDSNSDFGDDDDLPSALIILETPAKAELPTINETTPAYKKGIICPVCMDNVKQISDDKRKLMSTTCGHIFCSNCINSAVTTQGKCPTCRKKLKKKQLHPIFL